MSETTCPACGHAAEGRFCSNCGASLPGKVTCTACGNEIPAGGRFCNQCGTPTPAASSAQPNVATAAGREGSAAAAKARPPTSTLPWVVAGLAVVALVISLLLPRGKDQADSVAPAPSGQAQPGPGGASRFGDASSVDLGSMTPRERADALFNRVMTNVSTGDSTQAEFFLPMALAAYEEVPALDADGHYHVAVLHLAGGDPAAARARADSILGKTPSHLFGLFTAAQAERAMGNADQARELYSRFRSAFAAESALARSEYTEHENVIPLMKEEAAQALQGM